jgi:hypothetical protein
MVMLRQVITPEHVTCALLSFFSIQFSAVNRNLAFFVL